MLISDFEKLSFLNQLFNGLKQRAMFYTEQGLLMIREKNIPVERKAITAEGKSYINKHFYELSGYARLELTV